MSLEIYYFSGTGNSLYVAREIARNAGGTLIPVGPAAERDVVRTDADCIGLVFPCYLAQLHGVPLVVERFVRKLESIGSKRLFAVCTCGGYKAVNALPALRALRRTVRAAGGRLSGMFSVRLPMNNLSYYAIQTRNHERIFETARKKVPEISRRVREEKPERGRAAKSLLNLSLSPMYRLLRNLYVTFLRKTANEPPDSALRFRELIPLTDRSIVVDPGRCTGCGTCAKVCPVGNIVMSGRVPEHRHRCEMCMACAEWCPERAVRHWNIAEGKSYRHPEVRPAEMVIR